MSSKAWFLAATLLIVLSESIMFGRNLLPAAVSSAPVFHLVIEGGNPTEAFRREIQAYKADRGAQSERELTDQISLTTIYFEWDQVGKESLMNFTYHAPEVCNVASGLSFEGRRPSRTHTFPNGQKLGFDVTSFKTPLGRSVHVFKATWLQGVGDLELRRKYDRIERLGGIVRQVGQARVLESGIFGSGGDQEAWTIFHDEVLSQVRWSDSHDLTCPPN
jgi:hypothetical protein